MEQDIVQPELDSKGAAVWHCARRVLHGAALSRWGTATVGGVACKSPPTRSKSRIGRNLNLDWGQTVVASYHLPTRTEEYLTLPTFSSILTHERASKSDPFLVRHGCTALVPAGGDGRQH